MRSLCLRAAAAAVCLNCFVAAAFALPPISSTIDEATESDALLVSAASNGSDTIAYSADDWRSDSSTQAISTNDSYGLGQYCSCGPLWTVNAGAIFLNRSSPSPATIVVPTAGPGQISGGEDFNLGWTSGPDFSIIRREAGGSGVELRYFGALNWSDTVQYGVPGNFRLGSFSNFGATDLFARYNSRLNSTEINWLGPVSSRITWLAGFRAIGLHDVLNYHVTFPAFSADYNWNVDNHLYGGQLGTYLALWNLDGPFTINAGLKAGVYGNAADNDFSLRPSTGGLFTGGGAGRQAAFVGDVNVIASYQITNHIALRGGYQMLWIDHVALASDQAAAATAASNNRGIDNHGHVFYHGALAGVSVMW